MGTPNSYRSWCTMMKPWQTPWNNAPCEGGKEGTKREDPTPSPKNITLSGSQRGNVTNHVPKPPPIARSISKKKRDGNLKKQ